MDNGSLNVRDLGAAGDGKKDDTAAIQKAIDTAAQTGGSVHVPAGTYLCSTLTMRPYVALTGVPAFGYRKPGGSIIRLADKRARCLIDITGATGATLEGLCLDGRDLGSGTHGVLLDKEDFGQEEDAFRIERCQIGWFTGDGVHLRRVWCYSVRHSMICQNKGSGIRQRGWDAFILDNWLSGNAGAGFGAFDAEDAAVTMTGNRIEWNAAGGVILYGADNYSINGNYIDRCGGPGIAMYNEGRGPNAHIAITGNVLNRSGKWPAADQFGSAHIRVDDATGVTITGNTLTAGRDDQGTGEWSPAYAIVYSKLSNSVIMGNVLDRAAIRDLIVDRGGNNETVIVKDNPATLHPRR